MLRLFLIFLRFCNILYTCDVDGSFQMLYYIFILTGVSVSIFLVVMNEQFVFKTDFWVLGLVAAIVFSTCVFIHLIFCVFLSFFVNPNKPVNSQSRLYYDVLAETAFLFLKILRVKIKPNGKDYLPKDCRFLLVCNHISWVDPAVAIVLLRRYHIAFISRKENYTYPIANRFLYKAACLAIDRNNNREALKTINKAAGFIEDGVCAVGIFPEGWITKDGELQDFRNGAFRIAKKSGAQVLVAHISGAETIFRKAFWKKCTVNFEIKGVIPSEFVETHKTNEIGEKAREIMLS